MGGVRQQFTTDGRGAARTGERAALPGARRAALRAGGLPLPRDDRGRAWRSSRSVARCRRRSASRSSASTRASSTGLRTDDVLGATICREDGIADPAGVTRELVRRAAARGVAVREHTDALALDADTLVIACGARSAAVAAARGVELPVRPLVRQLADVGPVEALPAGAADDDRGERLPLPPRRRRRRCGSRWASRSLRWDGPEEVRDDLVEDWRERLAHRYPRAAGAPLRRAWAGFYDMTPDAHPIIGRGRRRRLRRLRLLRPRLHAVAGGRRRRRGGAARRRASVRPLAVPARALRRATRSSPRRSCSRRSLPGEHEHGDRRQAASPITTAFTTSAIAISLAVVRGSCAGRFVVRVRAPADPARERARDELVQADTLTLGRPRELGVERGGHPQQQAAARGRLLAHAWTAPWRTARRSWPDSRFSSRIAQRPKVISRRAQVWPISCRSLPSESWSSLETCTCESPSSLAIPRWLRLAK